MAEHPDLRPMCTGNLRGLGLAILFALAALALSACGSGGADSTTATRPAVSAATADRLAKLSDRVATDLDAGDTCHAAHAADDLRTAVEGSDLPASLRPAVDEVAGNLVDEVNCPPPPPPPPEQKHEGDQGDQNQGNDHGPKPPGHGGKVPPGHAKLPGGTE